MVQSLWIQYLHLQQAGIWSFIKVTKAKWVFPTFPASVFFWIVAEDFSFNHIDEQVLCFKSVFPYGNFFSQAIKRCG